MRGALTRAAVLLGPKATVDRRRCGHFKTTNGPPSCSGLGSHPQPCPSGLPLYVVGRVEMGLFNVVKGEGFTWEEAFARVALSIHEDSCRRCLGRKPCRIRSRLSEKAGALRDDAVGRLGLWWSIREPWTATPAGAPECIRLGRTELARFDGKATSP
jgi:hypothetical protein